MNGLLNFDINEALQKMSTPQGAFAMGLLNRGDQRLGQAMGGAMGDMYQQQLAQQLFTNQQQKLEQQRQDHEKAQLEAQKRAQWAQAQGFAPGAPDWAMQAKYKSQFKKPDLPTGMRMGPNGPEYIPQYLQGQERLKRAGASSVNVTTGPKLPTGYMWTDPNDPRAGVQALPGSKAALDAQKAEMDVREQELGVQQSVDVANDGAKLIDQMLNHPGLDYAVGVSSALPIIPGTPAADFDALAKQMEGKAFLQAFENLKGGGQITQIEGEKATAAMARLQRSQSEKEYKASLRELRNIYQRAASRGRSMGRRSERGGVKSDTGGWNIEVID